MKIFILNYKVSSNRCWSGLDILRALALRIFYAEPKAIVGLKPKVSKTTSNSADSKYEINPFEIKESLHLSLKIESVFLFILPKFSPISLCNYVNMLNFFGQ